MASCRHSALVDSVDELGLEMELEPNVDSSNRYVYSLSNAQPMISRMLNSVVVVVVVVVVVEDAKGGRRWTRMTRVGPCLPS